MGEHVQLRAKFKVTSVQQYTETMREYVVVRLSAVGDNNPENAAWAHATPYGELTMSITNLDALNFFRKDQDYYLDFVPARKTT